MSQRADGRAGTTPEREKYDVPCVPQKFAIRRTAFMIAKPTKLAPASVGCRIDSQVLYTNSLRPASPDPHFQEQYRKNRPERGGKKTNQELEFGVIEEQTRGSEATAGAERRRTQRTRRSISVERSTGTGAVPTLAVDMLPICRARTTRRPNCLWCVFRTLQRFTASDG